MKQLSLLLLSLAIFISVNAPLAAQTEGQRESMGIEGCPVNELAINSEGTVVIAACDSSLGLYYTRDFGSNYWTLDFKDADVSYEKYDLSHGRFETTLEPETKREFKYTITTYHGERADEFSKIKDD